MKREVKSEVESKTNDLTTILIKKTSETTELEPAPRRKQSKSCSVILTLMRRQDSINFSNSENKSTVTSLIHSAGQNKLLSHEQRNRSHRSTRSDPVQSVCQTVTEVAQGLPPLDKFKATQRRLQCQLQDVKLQDKTPGKKRPSVPLLSEASCGHEA